jgi:hypothetical protein
MPKENNHKELPPGGKKSLLRHSFQILQCLSFKQGMTGYGVPLWTA